MQDPGIAGLSVVCLSHFLMGETQYLTHNLKEEMFVWACSYSPWWAGSGPGHHGRRVGWGKSCSPWGSQEAGREGTTYEASAEYPDTDHGIICLPLNWPLTREVVSLSFRGPDAVHSSF